MKRILISAIILSMLSLGFVACNNDEIPYIATTDFTLTVNFDDDGNPIPFELPSRASLELRTTVTPVFATNQRVTWNSSNPSVATVNNYGLVTADSENEGIATITASIPGFSSTATVNVFFVALPPTVETIETYEPDPRINSVAAFLAGGGATYEITLMSPRLHAWREAYRAAVPQFDRFLFVLPSIAQSTSAAPDRSIAFRITYQYPIGNVWNFATLAMNPPALVPMTGEGNNPNSDAVFTPMRRIDRTGAVAWGDPVPHSTSPPNFSINDGNPLGLDQAAVTAAVLGIFTPGVDNNWPAANDNLIGLLNSTAGWTVIQDLDTFWFRSKADPTDWFVAVRQ